MAYFTEVSGHQAFLTVATNTLQQQILAASEWCYDITANTTAGTTAMMCGFFGAEIPASPMQTEYIFTKTSAPGHYYNY